MKQSTLDSIEQAKEEGFVVDFCSLSMVKGSKIQNSKKKISGSVFGVWASRYNRPLLDALADLYSPLGSLFAHLDGKCEGCFLLVNTANESIVCLYLGLYNRLQILQISNSIEPMTCESKDWKNFVRVDKEKKLEAFSDALAEFGRCAHAYNQLPATAEKIEGLLAENHNQKTFKELGVSLTRAEMEEVFVEAENFDFEGNQYLSLINCFFSSVTWGDLNNQDCC